MKNKKWGFIPTPNYVWSWGFTIIELLVVISIIAILAGLIIVNVTKARSRGRDAKRIADLSTVQLAVEQYQDAKGAYPSPVTNNCWLEVKPGATSCGGAAGNFSTLVQPYLSPLPQDPKKNDSTYRYEIYIPSPYDHYWIRARMEDESSKNAGKYCYYVIGGIIPTGDEMHGSGDAICQ